MFGVGGCGILGAAMSACLWKWILLGLGALGGLSLGLVLFSSSVASNIVNIPTWIRPVTLASSALIGALLLKRFERSLIIFATAISGSLLFVFGLDCFLTTGFDLIIFAILSGNVNPTKLDIKEERQIIGMILFWAGMTIIGILIQVGFIGKNINSHTKK